MPPKQQLVAIGTIALVVFGLIFARQSSDHDPAARSAQSIQTTESTQPKTDIETPEILGDHKPVTNVQKWLQTDATNFAAFDNSVRIVQFWTFGCVNCRATLMNLREIYDDYKPLGLNVVGIHTPEFSYEEDIDSVASEAKKLGVTWPIAIDNDRTNFNTWQGSRKFWPRTMVLDRNGKIRFDRIGEGAYTELRDTVDFLINNPTL